MKNVLITGTTSGIGKALAEKFASEKMNIILVARDRKNWNSSNRFCKTNIR